MPPEPSNQTTGAVRVRSNVCVNEDAKNLIPGDVLRQYGMDTYEVTQRQRDELMYYVPCCHCRRTIQQINLEGCDEPECRRQGIPSKADMTGISFAEDEPPSDAPHIPGSSPA